MFFIQGGDAGTKRAKVDQEIDRKVDGESYLVERSVTTTGQEQQMASTSQENAASTSNITSVTRTEKSGYDQLPKEMHQMKIRDEKTTNCDEKASFHIYLPHSTLNTKHNWGDLSNIFIK